jgi:hypothetical protein
MHFVVNLFCRKIGQNTCGKQYFCQRRELLSG